MINSLRVERLFLVNQLNNLAEKNSRTIKKSPLSHSLRYLYFPFRWLMLTNQLKLIWAPPIFCPPSNENKQRNSLSRGCFSPSSCKSKMRSNALILHSISSSSLDAITGEESKTETHSRPVDSGPSFVLTKLCERIMKRWAEDEAQKRQFSNVN